MPQTSDLLRSPQRNDNLIGLRQANDIRLVPLIRKFIKSGSLRSEATEAAYRSIAGHFLQMGGNVPLWEWKYYLNQLKAFYPGYIQRLFDDLMKTRKLDDKMGYLRILLHCEDSLVHRKMVYLIQKDTDPRLRATAVKYLGPRIGKNEFLDILKFLEDKDARVVANAIESVGERGDYRLENICLRFRNSDNSRIRGNSLLSLWRLGHTGVVKDIEKMLIHEKAVMRATAVWVLGEIGATRAFDNKAMINAMRNDPSKAVQKRYRFACRKLGMIQSS